jgi:hypothetical protein
LKSWYLKKEVRRRPGAVGLPLKTFFLIHGSVDIDGGEVLFLEERGERDASLHGLDEDNDLVEFERVEQIEKLSVLLVLLDLDIVLLETVEGQLGFVVDEDFHGLQRERRLESDYRASHLSHPPSNRTSYTILVILVEFEVVDFAPDISPLTKGHPRLVPKKDRAGFPRVIGASGGDI